MNRAPATKSITVPKKHSNILNLGRVTSASRSSANIFVTPIIIKSNAIRFKTELDIISKSLKYQQLVVNDNRHSIYQDVQLLNFILKVPCLTFLCGLSIKSLEQHDIVPFPTVLLSGIGINETQRVVSQASWKFCEW